MNLPARYYLGLDNTPEERLILEVKTPEQIEAVEGMQPETLNPKP